MIVRLDLEDHVVLVVEADDAGVVLEDADAPVASPGGARIFCVAAKIVSLSMFSNCRSPSGPGSDPPGQRLVAAMLAPGLGDRLQLHVGGVALERTKVTLDRLHLRQREAQLALTAEFANQCLVVQSTAAP